jgi:hypothetical protein
MESRSNSVKQAKTRALGGLVQQHMLNKALSEYGGQIPKDMTPDVRNKLQRGLNRANMYGELTNIATLALLAGGARGLLSRAPAFRAAAEEDEEKQASENTNALAFVEKQSGDAPKTWWGSTPWALPATAAAVVAPFTLGSWLSGSIADKAVKAKMEERKRELREEFEALLAEGATPKVAFLNGFLDKAYEKQANDKADGKPGPGWSDIGNFALGNLLLYALGSGGAGFAVGRMVKRKTDPSFAELEALQAAARMRRRERGIPTLELDASDRPVQSPLATHGGRVGLPSPRREKNVCTDDRHAFSGCQTGSWPCYT